MAGGKMWLAAPRRRFKKKAPATKAQDRHIRAVARQVIRKQVEPKYLDGYGQYSQIDRVGVMVDITAITQAVGVNSRIGDEVRALKLEFRLDAYLNCVAAATDSTHHLRVIIFKWNISTAVLSPAAGNILAYTASNLITSSPYNYQAIEQKDCNIVYDRSMTVHRYGGVTTIRRKLSLRNSKVAFDPAATTGEGKYFLLLVGDDASGAHVPDIQAQYYTRLIYEDA